MLHLICSQVLAEEAKVNQGRTVFLSHVYIFIERLCPAIKSTVFNRRMTLRFNPSTPAAVRGHSISQRGNQDVERRTGSGVAGFARHGIEKGTGFGHALPEGHEQGRSLDRALAVASGPSFGQSNLAL